MEIKENDFYNDLYVVNSMEKTIGYHSYTVEIYEDSVVIRKDGTLWWEDSPAMMYKIAEVILNLTEKYVPENTKITRKISEDIDSWYVQIDLKRDIDNEDRIRKSYRQSDGNGNWAESEVVEILSEDAEKLFRVIMTEIELA